MFRKIMFISLISLVTVLTLVNCSKIQELESFAPGDLPQAVISTIIANGSASSSLYCSISGGCPIRLTGTNFFKKARVFVGSYECDDVVISDDFTTIDCNVGPGQNGVYDISVKNIDNEFSTFAPGVSSTVLQYSYASFLYLGVANSPGEVHGFAQHPTTGALLPLAGSPFATGGNGTYGVTMSVNNKFLFSTNFLSNTITSLAINPLNGNLTSGSVVNSDSSGSKGPNGLFAHPSGNFLYVSNFNGNDISGYSINSSGALVPLAGSPFTTSGAIKMNALVGSSDGRFLFAAAGSPIVSGSGVVVYTVNPSTGALTVVEGSPFRNNLDASVVANRGDGISIHPNGRWLYVGLFYQGKVAGWDINQTTGALTPLEAPVDNGSVPDDGGSAVTVSADGLFLYGTAFSSSNPAGKRAIVYEINPDNGRLTRRSQATTQGGPNDIRIDTTGNYAYTCNTLNDPSISAFSVNKTTGALTPLTPAYYNIDANNNGPGIMVIQRNR